jgi:hypothetical protein
MLTQLVMDLPDGLIRLTATAGVAPFTYSISGISGLGIIKYLVD